MLGLNEGSIMKAYQKTIRFLKMNGWEMDTTEKGEYTAFNKKGGVSVDVSYDETVILDDTGDIYHFKTNIYALIGYLIHYRQISVAYKWENDL